MLLFCRSWDADTGGDTFPTAGSDSDPVTLLEQFVVGDGIMDLCLKDMEKALLAELLTGLWALEDSSDGLTEVAGVSEGFCWLGFSSCCSRCSW